MHEIQKFYDEYCDENRRLISQLRQIEYITTMKYLRMYCQKGMSVLEACPGGDIYVFLFTDLCCHVIGRDLIDILGTF